ncbi:MAG: hypothetical protein ACI8RZ_000752 [Myxococcota bacterium]|jgi:hypothetical protein
MSSGRRLTVELLLAVAVFSGMSVLLTWPAAAHLDEVIVGGGEFGGWLWRQWWHFEEVAALSAEDQGLPATLSALIGLGRFPETGNILDILLLSYPLRELVGFPADHNLKVMLILMGNGLCGYALARSFTDSVPVSIAAASVAIFNPLVIQDINKTGLRQVLLWWLLLYPIFLARAGRTCERKDGVIVGILFSAIAAFYWFYGLFTVMLTAVWVGWWWWTVRPPWQRAFRWLLPSAATAALGIFLFLMPYLSGGQDEEARGGSERLPEVTFLLSYPDYDTVAAAPLRPTSYRENVLSSLHRGIDSAWPADHVLDPRHGVKAFPAVVFLFGVIPAIFIPRARIWLAIYTLFWLGTMGPFLKLGAQKDTADVVMLGDYVIRMPYTLMFKVVPGMSRMFAPYRMASMVVVAAVVLVSISLDQLRLRRRVPAALLMTAAILLQPFYRFDLEDVPDNARPSMWRVPTQISAMEIPDWYTALDPEGWEGIIELPLDQQQDLICTYQSFHHRKVYRSWATSPAIPPWIRRSGGGEVGRRLRWLASAEPRRDPTEDVFRHLSSDPLSADLSELTDADLDRLLASGDYRWMVIHERGYYLVDPSQGSILYRDVVRRLSERLGIDPEQHTEQVAFEWPGKRRHFPVGPAWIPWASQEVSLPTPDLPSRYLMAVFDLGERHQPEVDGGPVDNATSP